MYFEASLAEKARKFFRLVLRRAIFPPRDITIEVTTKCGRGCAVCFRGPLGVRQTEMSRELFGQVLGAIREAYGGGGPRYLNFVGLGEPFCHPRLPEFLRLAAEYFPGTSLNVSTGLAPFDREGFAGLVEDGVINRLSVSLDGLEPGGSFHGFTEEVRGNLEFLADFKKRKPAFKLRVQTLITSREAVEAAVKYAAGAGAEEIQLMRVDLHAFGEQPPVSRPGFEEEREIVQGAAALAGSLGLRCRNNNAYNFFMDLASGFDRYCLTSDDHVFISAEGDALPCFYLRAVKFGNLAAQPLWATTAAREDFYGRQAELCRGCDIYKRCHAGGNS
ncbi:MAG TPA: hypothetical protein DEQ38_09535 [Elusimicrobia bacterium]|nr:MAG: hypothetical protein A2089_13480 [Elusimicrobia bacterium GWD2_63_28]HCC48337.1 hypothetical protein [Elusimicrobiota bacterium]